MLVIKHNTEEQLLNELKTRWESLPKDRCLHLKLSQIDEDTHVTLKEKLDVILNTFRKAVDDQSGQFYICGDHDVFILSRTLTQKRADTILAHLASKLTPVFLTPGLASLFEIGVDWPQLRTICEKKIAAIALAQSKTQKEKKEILEKRGKKDALKVLNQDLIKTLAERRAQRETPEIMVVEDDLFSQKMVSNALKNYSVSISGDGAGALMSYVRHAPDILFLDIGLPDIDGHEVLQKLFKIDPDAYVVMFSGNGDRENVLKAVELGAKGFVGKPFTKDKLIAYIEKSPFIKAKLATTLTA